MHEPEVIASKVIADDPPPVLGTWRRVYVFILGYLAVIIIAFGVFTAVFNQ